MSRPAGITREDELRWGTVLSQLVREGSIPEGALRPNFREMFFAGQWLGEQLLAHEVPVGDASDICFANGQRTAMADDPWAVAQATLAETLAGEPPEPGLRLAVTLAKGRSPAALLNPALRAGMTPEEMEQWLDGFRVTPRYSREELTDAHAEVFDELRTMGPFSDRVIDALLSEYRRLWNLSARQPYGRVNGISIERDGPTK